MIFNTKHGCCFLGPCFTNKVKALSRLYFYKIHAHCSIKAIVHDKSFSKISKHKKTVEKIKCYT